jgi:hypothetical protein
MQSVLNATARVDVYFWVGTTTFLTLWSRSTGCGSVGVSIISWSFSRIVYCVERLQTICMFTTHSRPLQPTAPALIWFQATGGPSPQTQHCRSPVLCGCAAHLFFGTLPPDVTAPTLSVFRAIGSRLSSSGSLFGMLSVNLRFHLFC